MVASITAGCPGPVAEKQAQIISPPPLCLAVGMRCLCRYAVFGTGLNVALHSEFSQQRRKQFWLSVNKTHLHLSLCSTNFYFRSHIFKRHNMAVSVAPLKLHSILWIDRIKFGIIHSSIVLAELL